MPLVIEYLQNREVLDAVIRISFFVKLNGSGYFECNDHKYDIIKISEQLTKFGDEVSASEAFGITVGNREQMRALLGALGLCVKWMLERHLCKGANVQVYDASTSEKLRFEYKIA